MKRLLILAALAALPLAGCSITRSPLGCDPASAADCDGGQCDPTGASVE